MQKEIEKGLGGVFTRINPDEEKFNIFKAINEIHMQIKKPTNKSLIDKISKRLLELELNNNKDIKRSCQKTIAIIIEHSFKRSLVVRILHTTL